MTNAIRGELFQALEELSETCPEYRFGQMIANLAFLASGPAGEAVWNVEDEDLLAAARKHLEDWKRRHATVA
jgi:hypothetical protein